MCKNSITEDELTQIAALIRTQFLKVLKVCITLFILLNIINVAFNYYRLKYDEQATLESLLEGLGKDIDEQILLYNSILLNTLAQLNIEVSDSNIVTLLNTQTMLLRSDGNHRSAPAIMELINCNAGGNKINIYGVKKSDGYLCNILKNQNKIPDGKIFYKLIISNRYKHDNLSLFSCISTKVDNSYLCIITSVDNLIRVNQEYRNYFHVALVNVEQVDMSKHFISANSLLKSVDKEMQLYGSVVGINFFNRVAWRILNHFMFTVIIMCIVLITLYILYRMLLLKASIIENYITSIRVTESEVRKFDDALTLRSAERLNKAKKNVSLLIRAATDKSVAIMPNYNLALLSNIEEALHDSVMNYENSHKTKSSISSVIDKSIKIFYKKIFLKNITLKCNVLSEIDMKIDNILLQQVIASIINNSICNLQRGGTFSVNVSEEIMDNKHGILIVMEDNAFDISTAKYTDNRMFLSMKQVEDLTLLQGWKFCHDGELYSGNKFLLFIPHDEITHVKDNIKCSHINDNVIKLFS